MIRVISMVSMVSVIPLVPVARAADAAGITVAAAMSLRDVMPPLVEAFRARSGAGEITVTYGASGKLRRQIEAGAPIDALVFASAEHVDRLLELGQVVAGSRHVVATNSLVLIGPSDSAPLTFSTIDMVPKGELIAIGDPESVPAGRYARQALRALDKWEAVRERMLYGGHVAAVLHYARRGEVVAAVVYETDVRGIDDIVILDRAGGEWSPPIETVAAVVGGGSEAAARAFVDFLGSDAGRELFAAHGFGPAGATRTAAAP